MLRKMEMIALVLLAVAGFVFGGGQQDDHASASQGGAFELPGPLVSNEQIVVRMLTPEFSNAPVNVDQPVFAELAKRTNLQWELIQVPGPDLVQKAELSLASGDLPDVVRMPLDPSILGKYTGDGVFLELTDYVKNHGPNITKMFTRFPGLERNLRNDDGQMFFLPELQERNWSIQSSINQRFLDDMGLQAPNTLDEFVDTLRAFKEKGPDVVPWGRSPWSTRYGEIIQVAYDTSRGWNYFGGDRYEYGPYDRQEGFKQYLEFMAMLYEDALMDPQMFSISDDESIAKLRSDQVGFMHGWADGFGLWGPGGSYGIEFVPMKPLQGYDGERRVNVARNPMTTLYYVNAETEYPDELFKYLDYIFSDEAIELFNWGIEGLTYTKVNGQNVYTDAVMKHEAGPVNGRRHFGIDPPTFIHVRTNDAEAQVVGEYTAEHIKWNASDEVVNYPLMPMLSGTSEEEQELSRIMLDITKYVDEMTVQFIMGKIDVADEFDAFIAQLEKMGIQRAIEINQAKFERWQRR